MKIEDLISIACEVFDITEQEFRTRRRESDFGARMCVMEYLRQRGYNHTHIGELCGKDRVTVRHALEQYNISFRLDSKFRKLATEFFTIIYGA